MARSRSLAGFLLITRMFVLLLICLDSTKAAMGYDLLLPFRGTDSWCVGNTSAFVVGRALPFALVQCIGMAVAVHRFFVRWPYSGRAGRVSPLVALGRAPKRMDWCVCLKKTCGIGYGTKFKELVSI